MFWASAFAPPGLADRHERRRRLLERLLAQSPRDPHARRRRLDQLRLLVDDEERDAVLPGPESVVPGTIATGSPPRRARAPPAFPAGAAVVDVVGVTVAALAGAAAAREQKRTTERDQGRTVRYTTRV